MLNSKNQGAPVVVFCGDMWELHATHTGMAHIFALRVHIALDKPFVVPNLRCDPSLCLCFDVVLRSPAAPGDAQTCGAMASVHAIPDVAP